MAGRSFNDIKTSAADAGFRQVTAVTTQQADDTIAEVSAGETVSVTHSTKHALLGFNTLVLYSYVVDDDEGDDATYTGIAVKYKLYREKVVGNKRKFALLGSEGTVTLTNATYTSATDTLVPGLIAISDSNIESATHISFEADFTAPAGASVGIELGKTAAL